MCSAAGDQVSLAIGMSGHAAELLYVGRSREVAGLASEQMALLNSLEDPAPMMGLAPVPFNVWWDTGEFGEILRWSDVVIDRAEGDPAKGASFIGLGSPLAAALAWRSIARWLLGRPGWRRDMRDADAMARDSGDPTILGLAGLWTSGLPVGHGVLRADDHALRANEDAVRAAAGCSDALVGSITWGLGMTLLSRDGEADRVRGLEVMNHARDMLLDGDIPFMVPAADLWIAREQAARGDRDAAIGIMRTLIADLLEARRPFFGVWGSGVLAETLLVRGADGDLAEAQEVFDRLATFATQGGSTLLDITRLRLGALLARSRGEEATHRDLAVRYLAMAESLGFEGHTAWAEAMIAGG